MLAKSSSAPGSSLCFAIKDARYARLSKLSCAYTLRLARGFSRSDRSFASCSQLPRRCGYSLCTSLGGVTGPVPLSGLYRNKPQPQRQCSISTEAAQIQPDAVSEQIYPEPFCRLTKDYALKNARLPFQDDFPDLPDFRGDPDVFISFLKRKNLDIQTGEASVDALQAVMVKYVCHLPPRFQSATRELIEVAGVGPNLTTARSAAFTFLLSALHTSGALFDLKTPKKGPRRDIDSRPSLGGIYRHSSRLGCLPKVHHNFTLNPENPSNSRHDIKLELPSHGIQAMATASLLSSAIQEASASFIDQVQVCLTKTDIEKATNDYSRLNGHSASEFLRYYLSKNKRSSEIDTRCTRKSFDSTTVHYGTLYIDDQPMSDTVMAESKVEATYITQIAGAIRLINKDPSLWSEFMARSAEGKMSPVVSVSIPIASKEAPPMQASLQQLQKICSMDQFELLIARSNAMKSSYTMFPAGREFQQGNDNDIDRFPFSHRTLEDSRILRNASPMRCHSTSILDTIKSNALSIIVGPIGSGKSSQIPQMVLESDPNANIAVTQSCLATATCIAHRVAAERGEVIGQSVGYRAWGNTIEPSSKNGITYFTARALFEDILRGGDSLLDNFSHIFVDDIQEKDIPTSFLLAVLKRAIDQRTESSKPIPKIILLSADADSTLFGNYMGITHGNKELPSAPRIVITDSASQRSCYFLEDILPKIYSSNSTGNLGDLLSDIPTLECIATENSMALSNSIGDEDRPQIVTDDLLLKRTENLSPSSEQVRKVPLGLIAATVAHIAKNEGDGVILVILPQLDVVKRLEIMLHDKPLGVDFTDEDKFSIFKLHSGLAADVDMLRPVKEGCRKIILSTGIAENSVNIPEVRFVVDSGMKHETTSDPTTSLQTLASSWIDTSDFYKREGCAGQDGSYYAMFSKARFDTFTSTAPKVSKGSFESECLHLKSSLPHVPLQDLLLGLPEPPSADRIRGTVSNLQSLGAIDDNGNITALGRIISIIPTSPVGGKAVILGILFRCLEPALTHSVAVDSRSIFIPTRSPDPVNDNPRRVFASASGSDQIATVKAYQAVDAVFRREGQGAAREFCEENSIVYEAYLIMQRRISGIIFSLRRLGIIPETQADALPSGGILNVNSSNQAVFKALITSSLSSNLAGMTARGQRGWRTSHFSKTSVHRMSVNSLLSSKAGQMLAYGKAYVFQADKWVKLEGTTSLHPLMACLFGDRLSRKGDMLLLGDDFRIKIDSGAFFKRNRAAVTASTIVEMKRHLDKAVSLYCASLLYSNQSDVDNQPGSAAGEDRLASGFEDLATVIADLTAAIPDELPEPLNSQHTNPESENPS